MLQAGTWLTPRLLRCVGAGRSAPVARARAGPNQLRSRALTVQAAQKDKGYWRGAFALSAIVGGSWVALDDSRTALGVRRGGMFWVQVFPIYLHYRLTEELVKGKSEEEVERAYNALHDKYAAFVIQLCINLGGYFYKAAQIVSTRDEFVPPQYMRELKRLQGDAPPQRDAADAKALVTEALGMPLGQVFRDFGDVPIGAASIGQVHAAVLNDGTEVAVKVMYPRVEDYFRSDMRIIKDFCTLAMQHHLPALREIEKQFLSEFDFKREADNMRRVATMLNSHPKWGKRVRVPVPFESLCTDSVLVMEHLPGVKLEDGIRRNLEEVARARGRPLKELEEEHVKRIQETGLRAASIEDMRMRFYHAYTRALDLLHNVPRFAYNCTLGLIIAPLQYVHTPVAINLAAMLQLLLQVHAYEMLIGGVFNGDPHPGNILLMPDGRLGLIDYGSCVDMSMGDRVKLSRLIVALAMGTPERVAEISMKEMGVKTKHMKPEIHYRSAAFWYDRDTPDVTGGMNVHKFLEWLHEQDPIVRLPDEFVMAGRVSVLLRGMGAAFGLHVSTAQAWKGMAEELLRSQGLREDGVLLSKRKV